MNDRGTFRTIVTSKGSTVGAGSVLIEIASSLTMTLVAKSKLQRLRRVFAPDPQTDANRRDEVIAHSVGSHAPTVPSLIVPDRGAGADDVLIAERLLRAYRLAIADESNHTSRLKPDVWTGIRKSQSEFQAALAQNDPRILARHLANMCRHDATTGTVQGNMEFEKIRTDPGYWQFITLMTKDKLVLLAEAVGAIACENPEGGPWGESLHMDIDLLVRGIEEIVGLDISPPPIDGGLLKIQSTKALFNERDLNALFTAWSLRQILAETESASICEIGAGSGRVAYWCNRFGLRSYAIFDLPQINVVQSYYLLKSLPDAQFFLYGEEEKANDAGITILPYFSNAEIKADTFDLVLNQDSLPEMNRETAVNYLVWIQRVSRQFFYSINHESRPPAVGEEVQLNVSELVSTIQGYRRVSRVPYWLRKGYVSELYLTGREPISSAGRASV